MKHSRMTSAQTPSCAFTERVLSTEQCKAQFRKVQVSTCDKQVLALGDSGHTIMFHRGSVPLCVE